MSPWVYFAVGLGVWPAVIVSGGGVAFFYAWLAKRYLERRGLR